jgi:hypothetical protein
MSSAKKDRTEEEGPPRWPPSERYPDSAVEVLDPSFAKYRIFNAAVERLSSGMLWSEGPVWFGGGRYLLWSDPSQQQNHETVCLDEGAIDLIGLRCQDAVQSNGVGHAVSPEQALRQRNCDLISFAPTL